MAFSDQSALFQNNSLLTWQLMSQMAENDAVLEALNTPVQFSAYRSTNQSINGSDAVTKIQFDAEEFDSSGYFDSSTNFRFTPLVAGKYILVAGARLLSMAADKVSTIYIYKNGSVHKRGQYEQTSAASQNLQCAVSATVEANGSTDYFEVHMLNNDTTARNVEGSQTNTWFMGFLAMTR